jgi:ParB family protein of integrating conjugative element (PFGI_1 class)
MTIRSRTPETLTAVARQQQLAGLTTGRIAVTTKPNDDRMMRALTPVKPAASPASATLRKVYDDAEASRTEELDGSIMTLNVEDVHTYDKDVRVGPNPKYDEIKASLLKQGNNHRFSVTRRPNDSRYFVSAGGNTRLRIIKELWRTTQDKQWRTVDVVYRVWKKESSIVLAHMAENDVRADYTFWERALGIERLAEELTIERGGEVSTTDLADAMKSVGIPRSVKYIQTARFATTALRPVGRWLEVGVTQNVIAPAYRALEKLCGELGARPESVQTVLQEILSDLSETLEIRSKEACEAELPTAVILDQEAAIGLINRWQQGVATLVDSTVDGLSRMLEAQAQSPRIAAETLRAISRGEGVSYPQTRGTLPPPPTGASAPPAPARAPAAPVAPAVASPAQQPLRPPIIAPVTPAGLATSTVAEQANALLPAVELPDDIPPNLAAAGAAGLAQHQFLKAMVQLTSLVELEDCVGVRLNSMPLGYLMELPPNGFELNSAGQPVEDAYLRRCTWLFLAALSGQHDSRAVAQLPAESAWRNLADQGQTAQFMSAALADEQPSWPSRQAIYAPYIADVLLHHQLGPLTIALLNQAHKLMHETPERNLGDLTQLLPA